MNGNEGDDDTAEVYSSTANRKCQRAEIDQHKRSKPKRCRRPANKTFHINLGGIAITVVLCNTCSAALEREQAERMAGRHPGTPAQKRSEKTKSRARKAAKTPALQRKISSRAEIPAHMRLKRIENGRRELEKIHTTWREDDFEEAVLEELERERADDPEWVEEELRACGVEPHLLTSEYQEAQAIMRSQGIRLG